MKDYLRLRLIGRKIGFKSKVRSKSESGFGIMKLGMHVPVSGSIDRAVDNAMKLKCSAFQMFTRNPRERVVKGLVNEEVKRFRAKLVSSEIK